MRCSPAVLLKAEERQALDGLLRGGVERVRVVKHAQVLVRLAAGASPPQAARQVGVSESTARRISQRCRAHGLHAALYDRPRPGGPSLLSESETQRIIAMVCGPPPDGQARWTVRLIAAEARRRKLVGRVGRETIRVLLQGHDLKPWRKKDGACRR